MSTLDLQLEEKRFGATIVLGPLQLGVERGETVALTGPSGVGKTTLLRILAGLDRDFTGTLHRPERVAVVFQEPTLLPWRSARDNICLATQIAPEAAEARLAEVGLAGRGAALPRQLSLGQQRRLALARALAADPELLLLDEPFVSLDADLAAGMLALTARLLAPRTIATILVTHAAGEVEALADRTLRLSGQPATFA